MIAKKNVKFWIVILLLLTLNVSVYADDYDIENIDTEDADEYFEEQIQLLVEEEYNKQFDQVHDEAYYYNAYIKDLDTQVQPNGTPECVVTMGNFSRVILLGETVINKTMLSNGDFCNGFRYSSG